MATKQELNEKFFTTEGLEFISTKIKSMITMFNKGEFPVAPYILGYGELKIDSADECLGRIIELCELIGFQIKINKIEVGEDSNFQIEY